MPVDASPFNSSLLQLAIVKRVGRWGRAFGWPPFVSQSDVCVRDPSSFPLLFYRRLPMYPPPFTRHFCTQRSRPIIRHPHITSLANSRTQKQSLGAQSYFHCLHACIHAGRNSSIIFVFRQPCFNNNRYIFAILYIGACLSLKHTVLYTQNTYIVLR